MNEKGQTIVEYVLVLAMSTMIIVIVSTYFQKPLGQILGFYQTSIESLVRSGDLKYGTPSGDKEKQEAPRLRHQAFKEFAK
ncbi:MAG: hypothetical protein HYW47_05965 [Deltaproteobacteria bacterium]|nr:hypothetical protein [Deltaproteobacteria bacterium]